MAGAGVCDHPAYLILDDSRGDTAGFSAGGRAGQSARAAPLVSQCLHQCNTPLLVQLFFWYFASGEILPQALKIWLNTPHEIELAGLTLAWPSFEFIAGWFGLTLYSAPFIAEELRAGIAGIGRQQKSAALALGLTPWQSMRYVVLPQAVRIAMPPLLGQYMNVVKNSSLTMAIGVAELSYASRQVESQSLQTFEAFGVATILYIAIIAVMEAFGQWRTQRALAQGH